MSAIQEILSTIDHYASAYRDLQNLQEMHTDLLPVGDQKTGVIGEFYAVLYLRALYPDAHISFSENPSQNGWDIQVRISDHPNVSKVQVKTVSAYSSTRTISPISPGWDELYLLFLGNNLKPIGFWQVKGDAFLRGSTRSGLKMRNPDKNSPGSSDIPFGENRIVELTQAIDRFRCDEGS
jgi:hypothetical protein